MRYSEAQTEFNIRLYRWAKITLETEMRESFSSFQFSKEWPSRTSQFLKGLDHNSQVVLAQAMLLARHQEAAKSLNQPASDEAKDLLQREEGFRLRTSPGTWEGQFAATNTAGKPALAKRRQLKKAMKEQFLAVFGAQCLPPDPLDGKTDMRFSMKCNGWIIQTHFEFGRWEPEIVYDHSIWTGRWITKEQPAVMFANCIGFRLNYGNEIGIGSGWENITIENLEPTCSEIIGHCRRMFNVFPNLLEGLDLELLTP